MSKVIDEVVFKKSIEDMLQYLSDNCLYEFVPYDDTEISDLFSLTPEEAQRLSDLISDALISFLNGEFMSIFSIFGILSPNSIDSPLPLPV